jgi:hypothetical protein
MAVEGTELVRRWLDRRQLLLIDCVVVFLSAFLLFQVQPLIGNAILPWFGGSAAVWGVCMIFFQTTLLAGYLYAHWVSTVLSFRTQVVVHAVVLLVAIALLRILPDPDHVPQEIGTPIASILSLLATTIGLPYLLLSSTSPLLQVWFTRAQLGQPYGLYALSNLGSMLGLLSYPFVVQPWFGIQSQAWFWSAGFVAFAICCMVAGCGTLLISPANQEVRKSAVEVVPSKTPNPLRVQVRLFVVWLVLSACPSAMLLASTNVLCLDVASTPFLWVVPLCLYLVSLIICYGAPRFYWRRTFAIIVIVSLFGSAWALNQPPSSFSLWQQALIYNLGLFAVCMMSHGELVQLRPVRHDELTRYYLATSLGGAIGGVAVAVIAPLVFRSFFEYQAISFLSVLLAVLLWLFPHWLATVPNGNTSPRARRNAAPSFRPAMVSMMVGIAVLGGLACVQSGMGAVRIPAQRLDINRDFYGVVSVYESPADAAGSHTRFMLHGRITHGVQSSSPRHKRKPFLYYHTDSGIGWTFQACRSKQEKLRVGIIGLGAGTLACYAQAGDTFRFYEISPVVKAMADRYFTFLQDSPAVTECVMGDARVSLDHEEPQNYDLLVLDAFSSDAIPMHLLTKEALTIYLRHLKPDGVLAFHVTNTHLDLTGPVHALAQEAGLADVQIVTEQNGARGHYAASWHLLERTGKITSQALADGKGRQPSTGWPAPWTDDNCNLLSVIK